MAVLVVTLADLGEELRRLPRRDLRAVRRGLELAAKLDADRWIKWSIRGGGTAAENVRPVAAAPGPPKVARKGPKRSSGSIIKRLKQALLKGLGLQKVKVRSKKPEVAARPPPGYRIPVDTGDYAASWRAQVDEDRVRIFSLANPRVKASVIETGRRPAPIPIAPLADWVRRKLGVTDAGKARSIAFAISRNASKKRREGLGVLARAHPKIAEAARRRVFEQLRANIPGKR